MIQLFNIYLDKEIGVGFSVIEVEWHDINTSLFGLEYFNHRWFISLFFITFVF